jgi:hypothetical protein
MIWPSSSPTIADNDLTGVIPRQNKPRFLKDEEARFALGFGRPDCLRTGNVSIPFKSGHRSLPPKLGLGGGASGCVSIPFKSGHRSLPENSPWHHPEAACFNPLREGRTKHKIGVGGRHPFANRSRMRLASDMRSRIGVGAAGFWPHAGRQFAMQRLRTPNWCRYGVSNMR